MATKPVRRIRDAKRYVRPLQAYTFEQWQDITTRAAIGKAFLKDDNPIFLSLKEKLSIAETTILDGVREVREEHTVTELFKKIFIKTKQARTDELVGQIQVLSELLIEIQSWVIRKKELEDQEARGELSIERNKEKDESR